MFSSYAVQKVLDATIDRFSYDGLEKLNKEESYLFIANHRDIVLDSAIMQWCLYMNNHRTSQITFGSNLMSSQFIIDIGKLNKMFTFYRGGSKIETYRNALLHSAYIKHVLLDVKESVWIAQRDGRTKDGDDKTQASLIKMLTIGAENPFERIQEFNIVPVTISYEKEPCDLLKANELLLSQSGDYKKVAGEDFNSIISGITQQKGSVHISFGEPINKALQANGEEQDVNQLADLVCQIIDKQVYENFKLWPNNYVAYDLMHAGNQFIDEKYGQADCDDFEAYLNKQLSKTSEEHREELRKMLINMYAMPVVNAL